MIYFWPETVEKILETIKETHDCVDIANDLVKIERMVADVQSGRKYQEALQLDQMLRRKYTGISYMLDWADSMPKTPTIAPQSNAAMAEEIVNFLIQDRYGILFDTAMKKKWIHEIKEFIRLVE